MYLVRIPEYVLTDMTCHWTSYWPYWISRARINLSHNDPESQWSGFIIYKSGWRNLTERKFIIFTHATVLCWITEKQSCLCMALPQSWNTNTLCYSKLYCLYRMLYNSTNIDQNARQWLGRCSELKQQLF